MAAVCLLGLPVAAEETLEGEVRAILAAAGVGPDDASVTILAPSGAPLVAIHSEVAFKPASNMKIITTIAGLELLGSDYEFVTQLRASQSIANGEVAGDLVLWGTGDPNISGRFYDDDPARLLSDWARGLYEKGLRRVRGRLLVDDTFFDDDRFLSSWDRAQIGRPYAAEVSSLNLADNCVEVLVWPTSPGMPAKISVAPASDFVRVDGAPRTVASGSARVLLHRFLTENVIQASGEIAVRDGRQRYEVAVHDPALFFGHALAQALRDAGVEIDGAVERVARPELDRDGADREELASAERGRLPEPAADARDGAGASAASDERTGDLDPSLDEVEETEEGEPGGGDAPPSKDRDRLLERDPSFDARVVLVEHRSPLLADLPVINKSSQNLHAEVLLKSIGARLEGEGSVAAGARAVRRLLRRWGIDDEDLVLADGSGLSHDNRLTTSAIARLLDRARKRPWFDVFFDSLPIAAKDGTLERRFRGFPALAGRVHAKTGHIRGVSALSGYLVVGEEKWIFSMLYTVRGAANPQQAQERIIAALGRSAGLANDR